MLERSHGRRPLQEIAEETRRILAEREIRHQLARIERAGATQVKEVVLALNATVEGQTTAHYITEKLKAMGIGASRLAHGVPVGGELDYLDEGTLTQAIRARRPL